MKNAAKQLKNRKVLRFLVGLVLILIIVSGFLYWESIKDRIFIDDSLITAPVITIAPTSAGQLTEMDAKEGKLFKKGDIIGIVGTETVRSTTDALVLTANNQIGGSLTQQSQLAQLIDPS